MKLHNIFTCSLAAAGLSLVVACSSSEAKPGTSSGTSIKNASVAPSTQRVDEFEQAAKLNNLEGAQLEKFMAARAERSKKLEAYQSSAEGKTLAAAREALDQAKATQDEAKIKAAQAALEPLAKQNREFMKKIRAEVLAVLTLDQQRVWGASVLRERVLRAMGKTKLDDAQKEKVGALAKTSADKYIQKGTIDQDPYLEGYKDVVPQVVDQAKAQVLTAEQRAAMEKAPATAPARKAKEKGSAKAATKPSTKPTT